MKDQVIDEIETMNLILHDPFFNNQNQIDSMLI